MFSSSTSQTLVTIFNENESRIIYEQKMLIECKTFFYSNNSQVQLDRLIDMSIYNEFYITEEQLILVAASKVKKRRKEIRNISRKLDLFKYFISNCVNRFDTDEF